MDNLRMSTSDMLQYCDEALAWEDFAPVDIYFFESVKRIILGECTPFDDPKETAKANSGSVGSFGGYKSLTGDSEDIVFEMQSPEDADFEEDERLVEGFFVTGLGENNQHGGVNDNSESFTVNVEHEDEE